MTDKRTGRKPKFNRSGVNKPVALDDVFQTFYNAKVAEGMSDRTLESYTENYRFLCAYMAENGVERYVSNVSTDLIRDYVTFLLKVKRKWEGHPHKAERDMTVGLSPVTVNSRLKGIRTMFRFLRDEDIISMNPFEKVKPVAEPKQEIHVMSEEQLRKLLNAPNQRTYSGFRDYVLMHVLITGFFRIGEALSLLRDDIDYVVGVVNVRAANVKVRRSKTIPLDKHTLKLVARLNEETEDFGSEFIFLANYGEPLSNDQFRSRLNMHASNAGIDINVYPYLFRHTAATMYLEGGGDTRYLAKLMGHADLRMIMHYTHLSTKSLIEQHEKYSPINRFIEPLKKDRKIKR